MRESLEFVIDLCVFEILNEEKVEEACCVNGCDASCIASEKERVRAQCKELKNHYPCEEATDEEVERVKERMFITQSTVNRCLEVEYSIHPRLLQYFVSVGEKSLVKKLKEMEPSKVWERIDRDGLYGYYVCEEDEVYAVV